MRRGRGLRALVPLAAAGAIAVGSWGVPAQASASYPLPVATMSGTNYDMPDPGVLLYNGMFYGFSTDGGLREWTAPAAGGPWSKPVDRLVRSTLPKAKWVDTKKGIWGPHMIQTTSGSFVVYFSAALKGASGNPGSDKNPASGARCIGTATSPHPTGPFSVTPAPLVCFKGTGAGDTMTADPGNRVPGEGALASQPSFVTVNGQRELFLVYKTQGDPGKGQRVTIRMVRLADADGTTVVGDSHQLLYSSVGSFLDTIEVETLVQHGSWFILFVAHGNWDSCNYSTEWFKSQHVWAWPNNGGTTLLSTANTGLCGPGDGDVAASQVAGQDRIFTDGWVQRNTKTGVITTIPFRTVTPHENVDAARVMYAAVLKFASDGFTPVIGEYLRQ
jgi:hypothetical protein